MGDQTELQLMLAGAWVPEDVRQIDFDKLPRVPSRHTVVSDVRARPVYSSVLNTEEGGVSTVTWRITAANTGRCGATGRAWRIAWGSV